MRQDFEQYYLKIVPDPKSALTLMMAVQVLSSHSEDEEYLIQETHGWIKVCPEPCVESENPTLIRSRGSAGLNTGVTQAPRGFSLYPVKGSGSTLYRL